MPETFFWFCHRRQFDLLAKHGGFSTVPGSGIGMDPICFLLFVLLFYLQEAVGFFRQPGKSVVFQGNPHQAHLTGRIFPRFPHPVLIFRKHFHIFHYKPVTKTFSDGFEAGYTVCGFFFPLFQQLRVIRTVQIRNVHLFQIPDCFLCRNILFSGCTLYCLAAAKTAAHCRSLPVKFRPTALRLLLRCFHRQSTVCTKIGFRSEHPIVIQSQIFFLFFCKVSCQLPPLGGSAHRKRTGAFQRILHSPNQRPEPVRCQIPGSMHFSPVSDQDSLHNIDIFRKFPDCRAKLPHMFLYGFDAARLAFQSFSFQIIGKPKDHSLLLVPEKCENFPHPRHRLLWDPAGSKCSDPNPQKYKLFFLTGKIQGFVCFCRIKRIQMVPAAARILYRTFTLCKICPRERGITRRFALCCFLLFQKTVPFFFPHLFALLPHPSLKPYTGKSRPVRCRTSASYTRWVSARNACLFPRSGYA